MQMQGLEMSTDRRVFLVNKLVDVGLSPGEQLELDALQKEEGKRRMAANRQEKTNDERGQKVMTEEMIETWREVTRWEEIDRIQATLEKLKKEAKTASLEDAMEIYNRKFPS